MSLARDIADLGAVTSRLDTVGAASGSFGIGRNVILNSAMMISQRGTSFASVGNVYHLDRFHFYKQNAGSAFTVSQSSVTDLAGFANALKVDCTTADTSTASNEQAYIGYKAEGQDLQRFQKGHATALGFTLSFYVKTNKAGVYTVKMFDRDNSRDVSGSYTVADANWNRYTINFPADTTGKFDDDNASSLEIFFNLVNGSDTQGGTLNTAWRSVADASGSTGQVNFSDSTSNDWEITGIQLETGSGAATDFEHRSFGDELSRCQRYYHRVESFGTFGNESYKRYGNGVYYSATAAEVMIPLPVMMRAEPTFENTGTSTDYAFYDGTVRSISSSLAINAASDPNYMVITGTTASSTQGNGAIFLSNNNTNSFIAASAEL